VPADIDTGVVDGIYTVRVPRDRLSDPFAFAGRLCYGEPHVDDLAGEEFCVSFTPALIPRDELGPETDDFEEVLLQDKGGNGEDGKDGKDKPWSPAACVTKSSTKTTGKGRKTMTVTGVPVRSSGNTTGNSLKKTPK